MVVGGSGLFTEATMVSSQLLSSLMNITDLLDDLGATLGVTAFAQPMHIFNPILISDKHAELHILFPVFKSEPVFHDASEFIPAPPFRGNGQFSIPDCLSKLSGNEFSSS